MCAVIYGRGVYSYDLVSRKPIVANPYHFLVGCRTCANLCPVGAIKFPPPEVAQKAAKEHKIFIKVKKMLEEKFAKNLIETAAQYMSEMKAQEREMDKMED